MSFHYSDTFFYITESLKNTFSIVRVDRVSCVVFKTKVQKSIKTIPNTKKIFQLPKLAIQKLQLVISLKLRDVLCSLLPIVLCTSYMYFLPCTSYIVLLPIVLTQSEKQNFHAFSEFNPPKKKFLVDTFAIFSQIYDLSIVMILPWSHVKGQIL